MELELWILLRLFVAALLGAVVGYERERTGKDAGLRTHMLVALGAAMFVSFDELFAIAARPLVPPGAPGNFRIQIEPLATVTAVVTCGVAGAIGFGLRAAPSRLGRGAARVASLGYALPGAVVAAAVIVVYAWVDRRWIDLGASLGLSFDLLLTGSALGLVVAYVVRFLAVALGTIDAHLARVPPSFDEAARGLGVTGLDTIRRVHLPLLRPGLLAALLLVFVDVVKELPATMLLRPFGWDTLAVGVWQATSDARWQAAALPALCIVLIGLVPVAVLVRLSRLDLGR